MKKPKKHVGEFWPKAGDEPLKVGVDGFVTGYRRGNRSFKLLRRVPIKVGDMISMCPTGLHVNRKRVETKARPWTYKCVKIGWVAKRLRVVIFLDRDRIWNRRTRKPTKRFGKPYWTACDVRSYHVGCAATVQEALKNLLEQCAFTNMMAHEDRMKGKKVIRWRCLLDKKEFAEMEAKARKTGLILEGVEVPHWRTLLKLRKAR